MSNKLRKIYAISSGQYSDYQVLGVSEDEQTANDWRQYIANEGSYHSDVRVEEMALIPKGVKPFSICTYTLSVELGDGGKEGPEDMDAITRTPITLLYGFPPSRPEVRKVRAPRHNDMGGRVEVRGAAEKSVRKVMHEQVLMWRACVDKRQYWGK